MRWSMVAAVVSAEMRTNRRLVHYWVYVALVLLAGMVSFVQFTFMHGTFSGMSGTIGALGPRYLIAQTGFNLLAIFLIGMTFLAFDVRARDIRSRMAEVLDVRPLSNLEFLLGNVVGLVLVTWLPLVLLAILYQLSGVITHAMDLPMGDSVEPYSLVGFLFQGLTVLSVWSAVIVLLSVLIRYRIIIALISLALLGLQVWAVFNLPLHIMQWFSFLPSLTIASDIVPSFMGDSDGLRFLAHLALALGIVLLAAILHPRRDGSARAPLVTACLVTITFSLAVLSLHVWVQESRLATRDAWLAAHEAKESVTKADLRAMSGTLTIVPGDEIALNLELEVRPLPGASSVLMTLNPGLAVASITVNGSEAEFTAGSGLIEIALPEPVSGPARIALQAKGAPDEHFGYLDTHTVRADREFVQAQLSLLGVKPSLFDRSYVAVMPGGHWLPSLGAGTPTASPDANPNDYFKLDLEVAVPSGWIVAGPGRRQTVSTNADVVRYRFKPTAPVPHVGLLAADFVRRSIDVEGIEFELLLHSDHLRNLRFFSDSVDALRQRLTDLLQSADGLGLAYPYDGFSLVETPNELRCYGGDWRMASVQSMPGVMMLRETGFPTSRFESRFLDPTAFEGLEGGLGAAKLDALEQYFANDFNGGNLFLGLSRNYFPFQTSAEGRGAQAINFVLEELLARLLTDRGGYFSAHEFDNSINIIFTLIIQSLSQGRLDDVAAALRRVTTHRPSVWDRALAAPLADLEFDDTPRIALNALSLKSEAIARAILDGIGRERSATLASTLIREFRGRTLRLEDLYRIATDLDIDLEGLLGNWLEEAALPGFLFSPVTAARITDDELGNPRYQTRLSIRNDEATPGLIQLRYQLGDRESTTWDETGPMRVPGKSAIEVGILSKTPLIQLWTEPYLALNREDQRLALPKVDGSVQVATPPLVGAEPGNWRPRDTGDIIVDDLDAGFAVIGEVKAGIPESMDLDQGLPEYQLRFGQVQYWSRAVHADSWGKYRRTHALIHPGRGSSHAALTATLPHAGRWQLSWHLGINTEQTSDPQFNPGVLLRSYLGEYTMTLVHDDGRIPIAFDGSKAAFGWNDLGDFDLAAGAVTLEVANETTSVVVIVDAVRWRPSRRIEPRGGSPVLE